MLSTTAAKRSTTEPSPMKYEACCLRGLEKGDVLSAVEQILKEMG